MKKFLKRLAYTLVGLAILLVVVYFLGPKAPVPKLDTTLLAANANLMQLEKEIDASEKSLPNLRRDNEARIVWADPENRTKTEYSLVYLHGFSASQAEGAPMHADFAKRYGCNLYLARLYGHGLEETEALLHWTPEKFMDSAKRAIAIGQQLGEKVIVMGTSTGCTAAIYLASGNTDLYGLINYSPNIDVANEEVALLTGPWGLQLGRYVNGSNYHSWEPLEGTAHIVTNKYRLEAIIALKTLIDATMTEETFSQITSPFFMGYWYKNEEIQDNVVSVKRMLEMYDQLGTPNDKKRKVAFENATNHVLASPLWNRDFENVQQATFDFTEEILGLVPVEQEELVADEVIVE